MALDAKTGKVAWDHATADWSKGWRYTGGPFIVNGKVIQGMTGCGNAEPGGCFITGHDVKTGAELWRVKTIAHPGDPNYDTWNGLPLESRFGASAWISGSYDPEQNLVFYGTGTALSVDRGDARHAAEEDAPASRTTRSTRTPRSPSTPTPAS